MLCQHYPKPCGDKARLHAGFDYICASVAKTGDFDPAVACDKSHFGFC
jgi:hypothetical protein